VINVDRLSSRSRYLLNSLIIVGSVLICCFLSLTRLPGMEILGIGPDWLLIWLVTWSVKRSVFQGVSAGLILGLLQDGLTSPYPSHVTVLVVVGFLTARFHKQRYIKEELIAVVLIVFLMTLLAEMLLAVQHWGRRQTSIEDFWLDYQRIALASALLTSLWTPAIYYPLHQWWKNLNAVDS
jgi:rod shape-determining protein MreD